MLASGQHWPDKKERRHLRALTGHLLCKCLHNNWRNGARKQGKPLENSGKLLENKGTALESYGKPFEAIVE